MEKYFKSWVTFKAKRQEKIKEKQHPSLCVWMFSYNIFWSPISFPATSLHLLTHPTSCFLSQNTKRPLKTKTKQEIKSRTSTPKERERDAKTTKCSPKTPKQTYKNQNQTKTTITKTMMKFHFVLTKKVSRYKENLS